MAKIKFGMMMTDARGKLGGQVFSKNASGAYIRTKVTPTNPQTSYQASSRALFASISAGWSLLTADQRNAWNSAVTDWAKTDIFGDLKNPTGKALYQRLNNQAQSAGLSAVADVPTKQDMPSDIIESAVIGIGAGTLNINGANSDASTQIMLFATPVLTAGTKFVKDKLRLIGTFAGDENFAASNYTSYVDKYNVPTTNANIYIGVKYVLSSGQASPIQVVKATVNA